jgi:ribose transport system substrate-binding protein
MVYPIRSPFFTACTLGAQAEAKKYNINMLFEASNTGAPADQVSLVEELIAKKVDGIAISPADAVIVEPVIAKAISNNIPVITFDSDSPHSKRLTYIGTDQVKAAQHAAQVMADLINQQGEVIISQGMINQLCQLQRVEGFQREIAKYPAIKIVDIQTGDSNAVQTLSSIENMLQAHPNAVGLYGTDATVGLVIAKILKNKPCKPVVVLFDDYPETIQAIRDGIVAATIVQKPYDWATIAIRAFISIRAGKKIPDPWYIGTYNVTKRNVDQLYKRK